MVFIRECGSAAGTFCVSGQNVVPSATASVGSLLQLHAQVVSSVIEFGSIVCKLRQSFSLFLQLLNDLSVYLVIPFSGCLKFLCYTEILTRHNLMFTLLQNDDKATGYKETIS